MNATLKARFEESALTDAVIEQKRRSRGREIGTVEMYDKQKGFGFIVDADKEKLFVHQSQIVSPGFRCLVEGQKVSFVRGENRGKLWAEDVRNPDGAPVSNDREDEAPALAKRRRMQLKEQWRNFFSVPQYALKAHGETLPVAASNEDAFIVGETVQQLGTAFGLAHGCCATGRTGNECARLIREKLARFVARAYEESGSAEAALGSALELLEQEFMERARMKSLTDGAEVLCALFVHALNASGQPCVQLWLCGAGACCALLCDSEGRAVRLDVGPHGTKKEHASLEEAGFKVGKTIEVAFAEVGEHRPSSMFQLPAARLLGGRPFKTARSPVTAKAEVKRVREWRCVAGEELFLVIVSQEVISVLKDQDVVNAALDAWPSAEADGWEAAAKAVVRTAQAQGPTSDRLACLVVQCWWQEKPLQRLLARRADRLRSGVPDKPKPVEADSFDMFG